MGPSTQVLAPKLSFYFGSSGDNLPEDHALHLHEAKVKLCLWIWIRNGLAGNFCVFWNKRVIQHINQLPFAKHCKLQKICSGLEWDGAVGG